MKVLWPFGSVSAGDGVKPPHAASGWMPGVV